MGLDVPELDDVAYEELVEALRKRIPVYSDDWTDHNAHDPGITILEMLAWLAETYTYQLDQVTDAHRRKHLQLLGVDPRPPQPASVDLVLSPESEDRQGDLIEAGTPVIVDDGAEFTGRFQTTKPVTLTQTNIKRVVTDHTRGITDNTTANDTYGMSFLAFGQLAARGSAMYLGLDSDPFDNAESDIIDVTVNYDDADLPAVVAPSDDDAEYEPSYEVRWQYCINYDDWTNDSAWSDFEVRRDQTKHLHQGGTVALERDDEWQGDTKAELMFGASSDVARWVDEDIEPDAGATATTDEDEPEGFVWIRGMVVRSGYEIPPALNAIRLDVVPAEHKSTAPTERLHRPDGGTTTTAVPGQTFEFEYSPVLDADIEIWTPEDHDVPRDDTDDGDTYDADSGDDTVAGESWTEVTDFDTSTPDDRHYVLDNTEGRIRFGDGVNGKLPEAGQWVIARSYVYGGGERGNVSRAAECRFEEIDHEDDENDNKNDEDDDKDRYKDLPVSLADRATGGVDAETVQEAVARLRAELEATHRAVTLEDYSEVALNTPGVRFGRATAFVADADDTGLPGGGNEVRVVVVPYSPFEKPRPSQGFVDAVQRHLDRRRLLTDRVEVVRPTYVGVGVEAQVRIAPGYSASGRTEAVRSAIDEFLDPLGRANGDPWPFGRTVYKSELYEVITSVDGVEVVPDVSVFADDAGEMNVEGNVILDDAALPYPDTHTITVERTASGGSH